jgi:two-component system, OmpR family, phosphate regulon sensor histidine kinase PhoR
MHEKPKVVFYLLLLVILLPTLIFSLLELNNLTQYEKVIEESYKRQLESALFSVNQYTESVFKEWTDFVNISLQEGTAGHDKVKEFIGRTTSMQCGFYLENSQVQFFDKKSHNVQADSIALIVQRNHATIEKMKEYIATGYRKLEAFSVFDSLVMVLFICDHKEMGMTLCGIISNPTGFVTDVLGPKLQEIAREDFNIIVLEEEGRTLLFQSDRSETDHKPIIEKEFWLLPGYVSGITLKSSTIREIIKPRANKQLILIISVNAILFLGIILVFKTMRKEMALAQLKSEFVSNVSHEIRTPLALIQMYVETLDMGRVNNEDKKKEYYNIVLQESERLSGIVNKILNFTQIEKGKRKYRFEETDLNHIVEEILSTYRFHFEKKGFEHASALMPDLPLIYADKEAVTESVVNLIDNAIKYSSDTKTIVVRTGITNHQPFVEVKDFGIGISLKEQKYIFDKFYRVTSGDLAHKAKGTGLGLTIVKHVMDAHKGQVQVQSKKGSGSSFKLLFPPASKTA